MLQSLYIHNLALIEDLEIEFRDGLNCITGETGAGKSVVIDSIGFVLGARSSRDLIRTGTDSCRVTATFYSTDKRIAVCLEDMGIRHEADGTLIISRELTENGRNSCKVNGQNLTLSMLRDLGDLLIDIHGQHDNQSLMRPETHIMLLDDYGKNCISSAMNEYHNKLSEYNKLRNELSGSELDPQKRSERIDLLTYQINEIEAANIKDGEEEQLLQRRQQLMAGEKITVSLSQCLQAVNGDDNDMPGAASLLSVALKAVMSVAKYDERYNELGKQLQDAVYLTDDISREISDICSDLYFSADELTEAETRLEEIEKLTKKYGKDIDLYLENARQELDRLIEGESYVQQLQGKIHSAYMNLISAADNLHRERAKIAEEISSRIYNELKELEMPGAVFCVDLHEDIPEIISDRWPVWNENGADRAEFLISANRGEPPKPVAKIASGGELSRIMLAIKNILAESDMTPTLIFDEIDTGISGKASLSVGLKLKQTASSHQILCVTHSVQIAMKADTHIYLQKFEFEGRTLIGCKILDYDEKIRELARLLDGNPDSEAALAHAKSLLEKE